MISTGGSLLARGTKDEIIEYLRGPDRDGQALMTLGFVHMLRFLMVEVSEACHMASVLAHGETEDLHEDDEVEVEVEEGSFLQTPGLVSSWVADAGEYEEVQLVQRMLTKNQQDQWQRLLVRLQWELASQSKAVRGYNVQHLRARLFRIVDVNAWTDHEDQFYALLIAMAESDSVAAPTGDDQWVQHWADQLQEFLP